MARRKKSEESAGPSAPLWMATYGDMITLVLTFFVLLFSFSTIDAAKWKQIVLAFTGSSSVLPGVGSNLLDGQEIQFPPAARDDTDEETEDADRPSEDDLTADGVIQSDLEWRRLAGDLGDYTKDNGLSSQMSIEYTDTEITVRFEENVLFDSGKAELRTEGPGILEKLFIKLSSDMEKLAFIRIEGHTDNVPISTLQFKDNWDLSQARASAVLRYVLGSFPDIESNKFFIGGYGEYHPIDKNDTPEGRSRNRRVDIVLVRPIRVVPQGQT